MKLEKISYFAQRKKTYQCLRNSQFYSTVFFVLNLVSAQHGEATAGAAPAQELSEKDKVKKENKEFIDHHLLDAHDFTLMVDKDGHHIGFPLPVIIYDNGFTLS